jgi:predicted  nucleic acid-binding Zn-ribbon protein
MADLKMSIANCAKTLAEARVQFDQVEAQHRISERNLTAARNKLNEAQKTFDAAVTEMKADAPWNTKWHEERNPPRPVAV